MYTRRTKKALTPFDIREFLEAECVSNDRKKQLNTFVTLHPTFLKDYPHDIGKWVQAVLNKVRIWCTREGFGFFALWTRENFQGNRQEHLHLLLHVPESKRLPLEQALRKWLPGDDRVVDVRRATRYVTT